MASLGGRRRAAHCRLQPEGAVTPSSAPLMSRRMRRMASGSASVRIQAKQRRKKPGSAAWQSCVQGKPGKGLDGLVARGEAQTGCVHTAGLSPRWPARCRRPARSPCRA